LSLAAPLWGGDTTCFFDPLTSTGASASLPEINPEPATEPELIVNLVNQTFIPGVLGAYVALEPDGTTVSDIVFVSNTGPGGVGQMVFLSDGSAGLTAPGNVVATFIESATGASFFDLDLPLTGGVADLGVRFTSDGDPSSGISDSVDITVPEPASMAILGLGMAALGVVRRRRR
jgi:PEP-CTERM motif